MQAFNYYLDVWKKYAVFSGRSRRREYWYFVLFNFIVALVVGIIASSLRLHFLSTIYNLAVLVPCLAVSVRRLHDTDRSGWWLLIGLIPLIGTIILIVFAVQDSTPGANRFGPNPKEGMGSSPMTAPSNPGPVTPTA
ncbi:MAG TPA: DUF805 domain-containing protein [Candidatus Nanoarchaeia archaeon]|nr:DUF805 domain-containing protein [Candidatus Nanoarchaeia archaeon]